jgi:hypothetical protein
MKDDIKRLADGMSFFEKTAFVASLVVLILAIWVRTAHLEVDPMKIAGFSGITGFNVGHGTVFGPIIAFLELLFLLSILARLEIIRNGAISALKTQPVQELSPGDLALLKNKQVTPKWSLVWWSDRGVRSCWYFVIPPLTILVCLSRYLEFHPADALGQTVKTSLVSRIMLHFFTTKAWETRAALSEHFLDTHQTIAEQMPYMYSPLQPWLYVVIAVTSFFIARRAHNIYFTERTVE